MSMTQTAAQKIREILPIKTTVGKSFPIEAKAEGEEKDWFKNRLETTGKKELGNAAQAFLLSFHDDGVVWGKLENGGLQTSDKSGLTLPGNQTLTEFRAETLQECRLFNESGELLVWRLGENKFNARWIIDEEGVSRECFNEDQVLWGTQVENGNDDFTVIADGSEGLRHVFPQKVEDEKFKQKDEKGNIVKDKSGTDIRKPPLRLKVRHYLDYDDDSSAFVSLSRLVNVGVE